MLTVIEFVAFTVFVAVLSAYKTRDEKLDTEEGYFVAGHSLPGIVIAGSLMMTNLSAEQLVGTNGQAFSGSMAAFFGLPVEKVEYVCDEVCSVGIVVVAA